MRSDWAGYDLSMGHVSSVTLLEDELIILALLARALRKNKATKSMSV